MLGTARLGPGHMRLYHRLLEVFKIKWEIYQQYKLRNQRKFSFLRVAAIQTTVDYASFPGLSLPSVTFSELLYSGWISVSLSTGIFSSIIAIVWIFAPIQICQHKGASCLLYTCLMVCTLLNQVKGLKLPLLSD